MPPNVFMQIENTNVDKNIISFLTNTNLACVFKKKSAKNLKHVDVNYLVFLTIKSYQNPLYLCVGKAIVVVMLC